MASSTRSIALTAQYGARGALDGHEGLHDGRCISWRRLREETTDRGRHKQTSGITIAAAAERLGTDSDQHGLAGGSDGSLLSVAGDPLARCRDRCRRP